MKNNKFLQYIKEKKCITADGAMGTMLQCCGHDSGSPPELVMLENPENVQGVHQAYVKAGSDLIETNTFGANRIKLKAFGISDQIEEINKLAVKLARRANPEGLIAGSVGPTGKLMKPYGDLSFDKAVEIFKEQVIYLIEAGVDVVCIETMNDLREMKAAVIAAREVGIPIIAQMTFTDGQRTLTGNPPEIVAIVLDELGADVIGVNCVAGLKEAIPILKRMSEVTTKPLSVFPNAGLPLVENGRIIYPESPAEFVRRIDELTDLNLKVIGGCCGTSPDYIPAIKSFIEDDNTKFTDKKPVKSRLFLTSNYKYIEVADEKPVKIIGEKLNPTGRKDLKDALRNEKWSYLRNLAREQVKAGADLLDVNIGISGIDKKAVMSKLIQELQLEIKVPLVIDSNNPEVLEIGLQEYTGKALVNSVNGDKKVMEQIFPLVSKYGAAVIGLTLNEKGIPSTVEGRLEIARQIIKEAARYGIKKENIIIDTLVLTVGAKQEEVMITVETLQRVKKELGVRTTLGVSNVSHGMPVRAHINHAYLVMALGAGLDLPILNPFDEEQHHLIRAANLLTGRDRSGSDYISWYGESNDTNEITTNNDPSKELGIKKDLLGEIRKVVIKGEQESIIPLITKTLEKVSAQEIINLALIPGIQRVGDLYEEGTYFLPQLLKSAKTVQQGFDYLKSSLAESGIQQNKARMLLATVAGDIHDLGKNIVKVIFSNYGYEVIDLGSNVETEKIVSTALEEKVDFVGLSALMTTTMEEMRNVIKELNERGYQGRVIIGGAVTSSEFAEEIGADFYARDAMDGVRKINNYLESRN